MDGVQARCAGFAGHKPSVVAWALTPEAGQSLQSFKTLTAEGLR
jgi:hypothetical protein